MTDKPVGLGETGKANFKLVRQFFDLPPTRKDLVTQFERILSMGGVQKVLVQHAKPVEVDRFVDANEALDLQEAPLDDLLDRVRNGTMEELQLDENKGAFQLLFYAFCRLDRLGLEAKGLYVPSLEALRRWLGVPVDYEKVYGIAVHEAKGIPADAAILVGTKDDEAVGIRIPVSEYQPAGAVVPLKARGEKTS